MEPSTRAERIRPDLDLDRDGACLRPGLAVPILPVLLREFTLGPKWGPGIRLRGAPALEDGLGPEAAVGTQVALLAGKTMRPVRAVLFDKGPASNWALGWHQDRTIVVRERHEVAGFGPWSTKQGLCHVEPPFALIESMVTVRIHLDPVDAVNAPLRIALGSHVWGKVPVPQISDRIAQAHVHACLADPGDVWVYRTPIVHASDAAAGGAPARRVLQVDYCGEDLPGPLEWLGIA